MRNIVTGQIDKRDNRSAIIAAVPALLLCAVTLAVLILDIVVPAMSEKQYLMYPLLIHISSAVSLLCIAGTLLSGGSNDLLKLDAGRMLFLLFLFCIIISTIVNGFSQDALLGVQYRYIGVFDMITLIIAYKLCTSSIDRPALRKAVLISYIAISDLITIVFIVDYKTSMIDAFRNKNEPAAIFFHGNHYGYFLVMAVVICAGLFLFSSGVIRILSAISFILNTIALVMNQSMGCILAVAVIFTISAVYILIRGIIPRVRVLLFIAVIAVLAAIAMIKNPDLREDVYQLINESMMLISGDKSSDIGHGRIGLWEYTLELIKDKPLTGYGCEGITGMLGDQFWYSDNPHNEVLTYAAYYGVPAAIIYTSAVIATIIKGLRSGDSTSMIAAAAATAYFISSMFGVAMFYTLPFFFVLLGISDNQKSERE